MTASTGRSTILFTAAVVGSNVCQVLWLAAGARALPGSDFGTVLTAQAMYGLLQMITDNGPSFLGARKAARGSLTAGDRAEIVRARVLLAIVCSTIGVGVAAIGGLDLLRSFGPFALALCLFSLLNVWEPYGRGRLGPFALYLLLRSLLVAVVAGGVAIAGDELPLEAAGACELAAVLVVGVLCSAWSRPGRHLTVRPETWRSVRDIGLPAIITQYNVAIGTVVLGVSGNASAAAVSGVAFRMLTGVQALNGAVAAGLFPRLARSPQAAGSDARAARAAAVGGVMLGAVMLLAVAVAAEPIVRVLLNKGGSLEQAVIILAVGATGVTGLVMHRSFALVARGAESQLRRASLPGALVVTVGSIAAALVGELEAALVVVGGYLLGLSLTSLLITRRTVSRDNAGGTALGACAALFMPAMAVALALGASVWVALAILASAAVSVALTVHLGRRRRDEAVGRATAPRGGSEA